MRRDGAPPAVVLGGGVNLIEVVRSLALAGVPTATVAPAHDAARLSRHATVVAAVEWSDPDAASGECALLDRLLRWARTQPAPPPLLFTSDEALLFVSRYRAALAAGFRFAIAEPDVVQATVDKTRFAPLAELLGLPVPATRIATAPRGDMPEAMTTLGFPLIVKPHRRDRAWHEAARTRQKATLVGDEDELSRLWARLGAFTAPVILQASVAGPENRLESYHVYVDGRGEIAAEFTGRKIRTLPAAYGHTTALVVTDTPDVRSCGRQVVRALGLRGVAKVDFKRGPGGELFLLEVNPRFHLWHHPGARAGVNIPAVVYADLTGRPRPPVRDARAGVRWVHPLDVLAARAHGIPPWRWTRWARGCEAKAFWSWSDPLPLIGAVASRLPLPGRPRVAAAAAPGGDRPEASGAG
jgi:predicted ATP-grasp superfamily ATP-dependent carboligase